MSILRFNMGANFVKVPQKELFVKKELLKPDLQQPNVQPAEIQGTFAVDQKSKDNVIPIELQELLVKYQEEGCTKEEILNVLEKLGIQSKENGNKIVFEYNSKQYSLVFSSQSDVSQFDLTIDDSENSINEDIDIDVLEATIGEIMSDIKAIDIEIEALEQSLKDIEDILKNAGSKMNLMILTAERLKIEQKITSLVLFREARRGELAKLQNELDKAIKKQEASEVNSEQETVKTNEDYLNEYKEFKDKAKVLEQKLKSIYDGKNWKCSEQEKKAFIKELFELHQSFNEWIGEVPLEGGPGQWLIGGYGNDGYYGEITPVILYGNYDIFKENGYNHDELNNYIYYKYLYYPHSETNNFSQYPIKNVNEAKNLLENNGFNIDDAYANSKIVWYLSHDKEFDEQTQNLSPGIKNIVNNTRDVIKTVVYKSYSAQINKYAVQIEDTLMNIVKLSSNETEMKKEVKKMLQTLSDLRNAWFKSCGYYGGDYQGFLNSHSDQPDVISIFKQIQTLEEKFADIAYG